MSAQELTWKVSIDPAIAKAALADVRREVAQTVQSTQNANKSELSMRQQLAAVSSLQRQRSAALIAEWKQTEKAAADLAKGVGPVKENLQKITDIMQVLRASSATLQGPLGGVAGRIGSLGSLAGEAADGLKGAETAAEGAGTSIVALAGPIGIAVVAAAALTAGFVLLNKEFFDLAQSTAEWQGALFDLSQQTGVSVETLSALEVVAKTTGGSLEGLTASLGIFQKNLEASEDSTSKQALLMKELGIETNNTEEAFRQAFTALAKMPEGFHQTATALELFGRGGKSILAIIKETNGNLDVAIKKFREMGLIVSTEDAKAADEFNDQMALVQFQLRAVTATISKDAIPAILSAFKDVSRVLKENQDAIQLFGSVIQSFVKADLVLLIGNLRLLEETLIALRDAWQFIVPPKQVVHVGADVDASVNLPPRQSGGDLSAGAGITRQKTRGGGGGGKASTELKESLKEAELAGREIRQQLDADIAENERAFRRQARTIEEFTKRAIDLADQELNATIDKINGEQSAIERALAKKLITKRQFNIRDKELTLETQAATAKNDQETSRLEDERDKQIAAAQLAANQRHVQIQEEADQRVIESIKDRIRSTGLLESDAEKQIAEVVQASFARRKTALEDEQKAFGVTLERQKEIADELIRLEGERAGAAVEASRKIRDALKKESVSWRELEEARRKRFENTFGDVEGDAGKVPKRTASSIDQLFGAINENLSGAQQSAALAGVGALTTAFSGLGEAVGQAAYAWVLYGKAGASVRQVTAQILASIAQQAAVKAIFELAEGFAALALAYFGVPNAGPSAAEHFTAAAIYGSLAGVAAVTGRAVAGNSFNQATGGGSSGGSSAGRSSSAGGGASNQSGSIELGSQRSAPIHLTIKHEFNTPLLKDHVTNIVVTDAGSGGRVREAIVKEIKRQD